MHIALLGGTGDIGQGLTLRFAADTDHDLVVGSREADRAATKAEEYTCELDSRGIDCLIEGATNENAVDGADIVILAVPPYTVADTIEVISSSLSEDAILVSPAVGMKSDEAGLHYHRPGVGSVTAVAREAAPESVRVVGAYHNLAADVLANLDIDLDLDTLVVGGEPATRQTIIDLTEQIEGLGALDVGPIENAAEVESLTPLLINLGRYNDDLHDVGVRFD